MDIIKFEVLDDGDDVVKVDNDNTQIHVKKKNGEYAVYKLIFDKKGQYIDFNVVAITKGFPSIKIIKDATPEDLSEVWSKSNEWLTK